MRMAFMPVNEIQSAAPANDRRCHMTIHALIASHKIPVSSAHVQAAMLWRCTRKMGDGVAELDICDCEVSG